MPGGRNLALHLDTHSGARSAPARIRTLTLPSIMSRKPRPTNSKNPVMRFLALCVAYWAGALFVLSRIPAVERFGIAITVATVEKAFQLTGQEVRRAGDSIFAGGQGVSIVADCSPHVPYLIFAAVVLAFPSGWRQRVLGLVFGAIVIHLFNTLRILALIQILIWRPDWFDFAHVYLWQTGTVLVLFATFALWLRWIGPAMPARKPAVAS